MPLFNRRILIKVLVVICLSINVSCQPTAGNEEKSCMEQIQLVFKNCSSGRACIQFAFTDLKNDIEVWKKNTYAYQYYEYMENHIQQDQVQLMPNDFCYSYKESEFYKEIDEWKSLQANLNLIIPSWMDPKVQEVTPEYLAPKVNICAKIIQEHIPAEMTDQYIIAKRVYRNFTIHYQSKVNTDSNKPIVFSPIYDNFIHIHLFTSYVKHVADKVQIKGEVPDPNDYCSKNKKNGPSTSGKEK